MVLKQYSQITHDDSKHKTSAKRDTANGVAGLDASKEIINNVPVAKIIDMDEQSFESLIDNGDFKSWPDGYSSAPEGWVEAGGVTAAKSTTKKTGIYSAALTRLTVDGDVSYFHDDYLRYQGRVTSFNCWVKTSVASCVRIFINDGTGYTASSYHSGSNVWELLKVSRLIDGSASQLRCVIEVAGTDTTIYADGAILVEGSICPAFSAKPVSFIGWESIPPFLDENSANVANKPTLITRGLFGGYSLPEYAAGEELLFRMRVPHCWDGSSNPWFVCITSTSTAEDIGDKYKMQLEWQSENTGAVIPDTTAETLTDEITLTDGSAFYANIVVFELDGSLLTAGENLQMRLRRVAASASSVTNEIIVWHWDTRFKMNKIGTESIQGY